MVAVAGTPLPLISLEAMRADPLSPPDWLIEPLIGLGSRGVVYGEFGSFKSWGLLDLGLHVAAGQPWLGQFGVPHARRVLYVDEEMSPRLLRRRVQRLALGMTHPPEPGMFAALSRHGVQCGPDGVGELLADLSATAFNPEVIIIETAPHPHRRRERRS